MIKRFCNICGEEKVNNFNEHNTVVYNTLMSATSYGFGFNPEDVDICEDCADNIMVYLKTAHECITVFVNEKNIRRRKQ